MRFMSKIAIMLFITTLFFNVYQYSLYRDAISTKKVDNDFQASLARISTHIDGPNDYLIAIEHASKANSLAKYTSYESAHANAVGYTATFINLFRELHIKQTSLENTNTDELKRLFVQLSSDPTNYEVGDKILLLLRSKL